MKPYLAAALLSFAHSLLAADAPSISRVEIVEKGSYEAEIMQKSDVAGSPSGSHVVSRNFRLVKKGDRVDAKVGARFGFRFNVHGAPANAVVTVKEVTIFPKAGIRDPERKKTFFQEESAKAVRIGQNAYRGYLLEKDWEVVPGDWAFEIWYGDKRIAREVFTLEAPR
ncbi:MAG: DUF3859 domain-containing protein [Elusimicrobia bacterium]|nr:DUF3859 domain-containing protein [Elusimicrobiota bacterium]